MHFFYRPYGVTRGIIHWQSSFAALAIIVALFISASAAAQVIAMGVSKAGLKPVTAATRDIPGVPASTTFTTNGITFKIWYQDVINATTVGFDDATDGATRQTRLSEVLTYVASVLNETGDIDIVVENSETDGSGFLASAGTFNPCANGFFSGSTLFRLLNGFKQFGNSTEEIFMTVDFGFNWNEGTGAPALNETDLLSVLLHEITHGLGLFSLTDSAGLSRFAPVDNCGGSFSTFTTWDTMVVTSGNANVWSGSPPLLQVDVSQLTSNALFFEGANAVSLYDQSSTKPGVYAPGSWAQGSSLSHWDTGSIVGGAVMEHAIIVGTQQREYSPVDIGGLIDIGYTNAAAVTLSDVYVTFGGGNGNGTMGSPFNNLADGLDAAAISAIIHIAPGTSSETFTGVDKIDQNVTLQNTTGASDVVIGSGARSAAGDSPRSGFVSRMRIK